MQWEYAKPAEFEKMAREEKVCILPMGVLERHGEHLPLGTDALVAHKIAVEAAKKEPCMVFPMFYFGQIHEASFASGAVAFETDYMLGLLRNVCDEIGRNGFTKIFLLVGHGGNLAMIDYFMMSTMDRDIPYTLYSVMYCQNLDPDEQKAAAAILSSDGGHADQWESSLVMSVCEDAVDLTLQRFPEPVKPLGNTKHLGRVKSPYWWYGDYPENVTGSPTLASKEKGDALMDIYIKRVAKDIKAIKDDEIVPKLKREFLERKSKIGK